MITLIERLGDRLLTLFVPEVRADAASTAACTYPNCGSCRGCVQRYRRCCNGVCGSCQMAESCCGG